MTRFMIGLLLLERGCPMKGCASAGSTTRDFQFFTGEEFFQHTFPHERSDLSHWRKRLGDKLELLLASLRVAHEAGALRRQDLQAGHGRHHGTAEGHRLSDRCRAAAAAIRATAWREGTASGCGNPIVAIAKAAARWWASAHAKQFRRHQRQLRILRGLGRRISAARSKDRRLSRRRSHFRWPRRAHPLAAAPARLEALFLPCPARARPAPRVRREGLHRHHQPPCRGGQFVCGHARARPHPPRTWLGRGRTGCLVSLEPCNPRASDDPTPWCLDGARRVAKLQPNI